MTGRTHDMAALAALGAVIVVVQPHSVTLGTALTALLANQIGGVAPDVDQPTAPFWRNLPIGGFFGKIFSRTLGGHRFLSHSIIGIALFGFLAKLLLQTLQPIMPHINVGIVWWAFFIGYVSHLVMDSLSKEGVPWLLPIPVKFGFPPLRNLRLTTGGKLELWLLLPGLLALTVWICANYYEIISRVVAR